jgi:DNA mismatch endonuclease, patch repair protein
MERYLRKKLSGGAFINVPVSRSRAMARIRGKGNHTTEGRLRFALVQAGISGWCLHASLAGRPDFYFKNHDLALFVDGCFWHGCSRCGHIPRTNRAFWQAKIERNRVRARRWDRKLRRQGIMVRHIWECQLKKDLKRVVTRLELLLKGRHMPHAA